MAFEPSNAYKMKIKITNHDDTRLWRYAKADDYEELRSFIAKTWSNDDFIAQYEDDENDRITIASAQDLKDALDFAVSEKKKSLKLFVVNCAANKPAEQQEKASSFDKDEVEQNEAIPNGMNLIFDFLSNPQITSILPMFFADFVKNKLCNAQRLRADEIASILMTEIKASKYEPITSHPLYRKYAHLAIPYIGKKIAVQQSLYAHFECLSHSFFPFSLLMHSDRK